MADRPNFFELLELDPQQTNWPEIAKRIKEKKGAWAKESTMAARRSGRRRSATWTCYRRS